MLHMHMCIGMRKVSTLSTYSIVLATGLKDPTSTPMAIAIRACIFGYLLPAAGTYIYRRTHAEPSNLSFITPHFSFLSL
jgi:hypothetical protein